MTFFSDKRVCAEWEHCSGAGRQAGVAGRGEHSRGGTGVWNTSLAYSKSFSCADWVGSWRQWLQKEGWWEHSNWALANSLGSGERARIIKGRRSQAASMGRLQGRRATRQSTALKAELVQARGPEAQGIRLMWQECSRITKLGKGGWDGSQFEKSHGLIFIWHFIETEARRLND